MSEHGHSTREHGHSTSTAADMTEAGMRGLVAAMAMSGMRNITVSLGIVDQTPPEAIMKQRARGVLRRVPRRWRPATIEAVHCGYGSAGGAMFGLLPDGLRLKSWAGPAYGLAVWLGFELGIAPALGLSRTSSGRLLERAGLAADHLLYGFVLSDMHRRPRD